MDIATKVQMTQGGPSFSSLVQGYWRLLEWGFSSQECLSFIKGHVDLGVTTVDHAHIYGMGACESLFGEALRLDPSLREKIEIISKCGIVPAAEGGVGHYNSSGKEVTKSVELSLSRFGIEYLDVLLIHRPDFLMDADEVVEVFLKLKAEGKVKHLGVSNFSLAQLELLQSRIDFPLVTNQVELNPVNLEVLESGILEKMQQFKMRPMAWSCLAGGQIFDVEKENIKRLNIALREIACEIGADSIDQVVFAWIMKMPSKPVPVLGSGNIDRTQKYVESLELSLSHEQWYRIMAAARGHDVA